MRTLAIDIETYSSKDISKSGVYSYVEALDFSILLFAYKYEDEDIKIIDLTETTLPNSIIEDLLNPDIIKTAYNANFERVCLSKFLNIDLPINQWRCTSVQALMVGLPNNLKDVAKSLGLKHKKDARGTRLINYFSVPCTSTTSNGGRTRNLPHHNPKKWEEFKEYCIQDVRVEAEIRRRLEKYPIPESEQELYVLDQIINDRGIRIDNDLINNSINFDSEYSNKCSEEFRELTNGLNARSNTQLENYLKTKNIFVDKVNKVVINELIESVNDEKTKRVLELRLALCKSSIAKYRNMKKCVCNDGRIRGLLQFYGANRTGRWAGRLVQIHNLPQNHLENIELTRDLVISNNYELLGIFYDNIPDVLSQLIRTAFIPSEGKKFIVCDFSAIEARVLAYLSNEKWRMDVFNTHGKIYEASASQMFKIPIEKITKDLRQKGKVAELALGYGGSVGALKQMGALRMGLKEDELQGLVNSFRKANTRITNFWKDVGRASMDAVKGNPSILQRGISFNRESRSLFITLPSGRKLSYIKPKIVIGKYGREVISYEGKEDTTRIWGRTETYGGKLTENIVQAVARDCLSESIKRLHKKGYKIVFHVHDEIIIEADENVTVKEIEDVMSKPIDWAKDLKLTVSGFETKFYKKE